MLKYNKNNEVNPNRNTNIRKWHKLFPSSGKLFQEATKRKALASLEYRMGGKRETEEKKWPLSTLLLLKLGDQMLRPCTIQTASQTVW